MGLEAHLPTPQAHAFFPVTANEATNTQDSLVLRREEVVRHSWLLGALLAPLAQGSWLEGPGFIPGFAQDQD